MSLQLQKMRVAFGVVNGMEKIVMNANNEEIQTLSDQIKEWGVQIESLVAKQAQAEAKARKYALELHQLRTKHNTASHRLRELESEGRSLNMWENIGDGG